MLTPAKQLVKQPVIFIEKKPNGFPIEKVLVLVAAYRFGCTATKTWSSILANCPGFSWIIPDFCLYVPVVSRFSSDCPGNLAL